MNLVSGKIYKCLPFMQAQTFPVLHVTGEATVYVSLDHTAPTDVSQMIDVTEEVEAGCNTLIGQVRYICAVFSGTSAVSESGIVTYQNKSDRLD